MAADYIYEPYTHNQVTPANIWNIPHGFGRSVNVEFYDTSGNRMFPKEEEIDTDNYRGTFYKKSALDTVAGKAVVS